MASSPQRTSSFGITARLNGVFAVVTLLVLVSGGVSLNSLAALAAQVTHTGRVTGERALLCGRLQGLSGKMRGAVRGALLYSRTEQPDLVARSSREFAEFSGQVRSIAAQLGNGHGSAEENRAAKQLTEAVNDWQPVLNEIAGLCARKDFGPAVADATRRSIAAADRVDAATELLVQAQTAGFEASVHGSEELGWRARAEAVALAVLTAVACLAGLYAVRGATRVLRQVSESLAAGSSQVRAAAQHVSGASQSLAQGACEQAASLQETAASTQQIKSMIGLNAEGSASAALSMKDSHSHIEEANLRLEQLRDAMKEIADSGAKISGIVKEIDAIAFQTNLLALNASIEAARAGAHGAGFAVVADEIRNLSARSAGSARNTAVLIEEAVARSKEGGQRVGEIVEAIAKVTGSATVVCSAVDRVAEGGAEQARGIEQIAAAVSRIEQTTQSAAAIAEESAAASEELSAQSEILSEATAQLLDLIGGGARRFR